MSTEDNAAGATAKALSGSTVRASLQRGDLAELKAILAEAEAVNKKHDDLRGALVLAQAVLRTLPPR